jgi:signal transduction histidine kinase
MINFIFIYFISYFLTYFGFLLAKEEVVKDELKEIQKPILFVIDILLLITYVAMLYFYSDKGIIVFTTIILLALKIISTRKKINYLKQIHNILLFGTTVMFSYKFLDSSLMYLTLFPIIILFIENTNQEFHKKEEISKVVFLAAILILLNVL